MSRREGAVKKERSARDRARPYPGVPKKPAPREEGDEVEERAPRPAAADVEAEKKKEEKGKGPKPELEPTAWVWYREWNGWESEIWSIAFPYHPDLDGLYRAVNAVFDESYALAEQGRRKRLQEKRDDDEKKFREMGPILSRLYRAEEERNRRATTRDGGIPWPRDWPFARNEFTRYRFVLEEPMTRERVEKLCEDSESGYYPFFQDYELDLSSARATLESLAKLKPKEVFDALYKGKISDFL